MAHLTHKHLAELHAALAAHHRKYAKRKRRRHPVEHEEEHAVAGRRSAARADRASRTAGRHDRMRRSKQGGGPAGATPPNVDVPWRSAGMPPDFPPQEQ
jgi:hypothetical protein